MSLRHSSLTSCRLKELLHYNQDTGVFTWVKKSHPRLNRIQVGDTAGAQDGMGYIQIQIDKVMHKAHRLAFLYVCGEYPSLHVDHINGIKSDNRICNLRLVLNSQNRQNIRAPRKDSSMSSIGVQRVGSRFKAKIQTDGKQHYIGSFLTENEAREAYLEEKRKRHPFCTI